MSYDPDETPRFPVYTRDVLRILEKRMPRLALAVSAGQAAWPAVQWARNRSRSRNRFTVKVPGKPGDALFEELHARILAQIPQEKRKALVVSAGDRFRPTVDENGNFVASTVRSQVRLRYDGSSSQLLTLSGHKVKVSVAEGISGDANQTYKAPEIVLSAQSQQGRDAVLAWIDDAHAATRSTSRKPAFWAMNAWDEWERIEDMQPRRLDSVILPPGQLDRIISDIGRFLDSEAEYVRRCMPWHRGHLYWGPPGSGKTSVARAIATRFGLDMWYLPLADVKKDGSLLKQVHRIKGKSVLLLEDIDVFHAATRRDDDTGGLTLSGVLNMLDGVGTPHGLIYVMTSNDKDMLDEAAIRTGRADLVEEFTLAGPDEARRFLGWWYGEDFAGPLPGGLRFSDIAECCKSSQTPGDAAVLLSSLSSCSPG